MLYLEVPATAPGIGGVTVSPGLVRTGVVLLAAAFPVGLAFGLLSTRRLTRRLGRLAALSQRVGDGDFGLRVPVRGHDEVSRLEENFNRMAGQLQAWLDATRQLGETNARHEERTRIARELHDSISQELFSLSVLAGGLRRALPAGSAVLPQVEIMERTAGDTMREMRSLLLALRPVALEEDDLPGALAGVCQVLRGAARHPGQRRARPGRTRAGRAAARGRARDAPGDAGGGRQRRAARRPGPDHRQARGGRRAGGARDRRRRPRLRRDRSAAGRRPAASACIRCGTGSPSSAAC